jgi:hypothetical protein
MDRDDLGPSFWIAAIIVAILWALVTWWLLG